MRLNRRMTGAVVCSALLHSLFIWICCPRPEEASLRLEIEVRTREALSESPPRRAHAGGGAHGARAHGGARISLGQLGRLATTSHFAAPSGQPFSAATWRDAGSYGHNAITAFDGLSREEARFMLQLWRVIDRSLEDSDFLSEYAHTGQVFFHFELDETGRLVAGSLRAVAEDGVLKVIAARALRKALRDENGEIEFPHRRVALGARFLWSDYKTCAPLKGTQREFLSFCHYAEDKRKKFTTGEKAATYLNAVQYGPGMLEEIEKYRREEARRRTQFDPFESLKRDPDWNLGDGPR